MRKRGLRAAGTRDAQHACAWPPPPRGARTLSQHAYVSAWQPSSAENSTVQIGHAPFSALLSNAAPSYGCHSDAPLPFVSPSPPPAPSALIGTGLVCDCAKTRQARGSKRAQGKRGRRQPRQTCSVVATRLCVLHVRKQKRARHSFLRRDHVVVRVADVSVVTPSSPTSRSRRAAPAPRVESPPPPAAAGSPRVSTPPRQAIASSRLQARGGVPVLPPATLRRGRRRRPTARGRPRPSCSTPAAGRARCAPRRQCRRPRSP